MSFFSAIKKAFTGVEPKPFKLPPKKWEETQTIGEKLASICARTGGHYERDIAGQQIRLCLITKSGEKFCGQGYTTQDAYEALYKRLKQLELV